MDLLYGLLGATAALGERWSRHRINYVSLSALPFLGLFLSLILLGAANDALTNGTHSYPLRLGDLVRSGYPGHHFVTVTGRYEPDTAFRLSEKDGTKSSDRYVSLVDGKSGGAVVVKLSDPAALDASEFGKQAVTVTGMLRYSDPDLPTKPPEKVGKTPQNVNFYLEEGGTAAATADGWLYLVLGVLLALPMPLYLPAFFCAYVIFRRDPWKGGDLPSAALDVAPAADLSATGRFVLPTRVTQSFIDVPARLYQRPDGELVVSALIDASVTTTFYFMETGKQDRSGDWHHCITPAYITKLEKGRLYHGFHPRPAIRMSHADAPGRASTVAVLTCADEASRDRLLAGLEYIRANTPPPAAR